mmetsp:Transcript_16624/g.25972  ORF Transcript_16624/g.25972 Transcript_16624/m.25972 type:complete len:204 (+) Transcript_16624:1576-2187(+)
MRRSSVCRIMLRSLVASRTISAHRRRMDTKACTTLRICVGMEKSGPLKFKFARTRCIEWQSMASLRTGIIRCRKVRLMSCPKKICTTRSTMITLANGDSTTRIPLSSRWVRHQLDLRHICRQCPRNIEIRLVIMFLYFCVRTQMAAIMARTVVVISMAEFFHCLRVPVSLMLCDRRGSTVPIWIFGLVYLRPIFTTMDLRSRV